MMYNNLKYECQRKGITRGQIASLWNVKYNTVGDKLNGKTRIYLEEAWKLQTVFFPEFKLEYLFSKSDSMGKENDVYLAG